MASGPSVITWADGVSERNSAGETAAFPASVSEKLAGDGPPGAINPANASAGCDEVAVTFWNRTIRSVGEALYSLRMQTR